MVDDKWVISESGFDKEKISLNGNKYLVGNGYMGVRGTLSEFGKEQLAAINLSGIYDKVGDGWREPLNAPNCFYTYIRIDGTYYRLPETEPQEHKIQLNFRHGIFERTTTWKTGRGKVQIWWEHFAHAGRVHLLCMRYRMEADFHADVEILTGIDGEIWDIHGPHYDSLTFKQENGFGEVCGITHENKDQVWVNEGFQTDFSYEWKRKKEEKKGMHRICFVTEKGKVYTVEKIAAIYTCKDDKEPDKRGKELVQEGLRIGYKELRKEHQLVWEGFWDNAEVEIEGDSEAMNALNYSAYHLLCIAPRHKDSLSIPARGLSGQTYKGAVFWDTEMFMLDFYLYTDPSVARAIIKYRIDTLEGAKKKAREYGLEGAFYAWESQEGGFDACTDYNVTDVFTHRPMRTYFRDKQYHISAAIVYGIRKYIEATGDKSILEEGGAQTILACAEFYYSLLIKRAGKDIYEIWDCIGPDEYHERINNNGYTNRMAKYTFQTAVELLRDMDGLEADTIKNIWKEYDLDGLRERYQEAGERIFLPKPDGEGIIEQFEGYFGLEDVSVETVRSRLLHEKEYWGGANGVAAHTKVIKQADVAAWLATFPEDFGKEIQKKNFEYYEPRTEHGSSLSACMYARLACECGMQDIAYPYFMKSAAADLRGGGKEWAGLVYIGGTHPAAAGGAYMCVIQGFAGVKIKKGNLEVSPRLPSHWKGMRFRIKVWGQKHEVHIKGEKAEIRRLG